MIRIEIGAAPLDRSALDGLDSLGGGAVASFTGIARDDNGVTAIELEHYPEMTQASLADLAQEARARWPLLGIVILHRVGRIPVGEPIVMIATASAHRAAALEACAFLIDRLKTDAPFWKKEHRADGSAAWVEARTADFEQARFWDRKR